MTMLLYIHLIFFFRMLATTSIIFAVGLVVYGVNGKPTSEGKVNNSENLSANHSDRINDCRFYVFHVPK